MDDLAVAFRSHEAFEYDAEAEMARATVTPFETVVRGDSAGDDAVRITGTMVVPALSAAVEETVGDAVANGWYDTFERRLADAYDVTQATGEVSVEHTTADGDPAVEVDFAFTAPVRQAVVDAAALVNFVEGTYLQGTIPGYTYRPPVEGLLSAARQRGQGETPSSE